MHRRLIWVSMARVIMVIEEMLRAVPGLGLGVLDVRLTKIILTFLGNK